MREVTEREAEQWMALAEAHGQTGPDGTIALGRYVTLSCEMPKAGEPGRLTVRFVTPVPAPLQSPDLTPKTPPIMLDRQVTGEIILPGRWWQNMFARLSENDGVSDADRRAAMIFATRGEFSDVLLPADTDTISLLAADDAGSLVLHESLPPGTVATMTFRLT